MANTHTVASQAYADFIDERSRADLVDLLPPVLPELAHGVDTTDIDISDIDSPRVDFGHNSQARVPQ